MWVKNCIKHRPFRIKVNIRFAMLFLFIIRIRLPRSGWKCLQVNMYGAADAARKRSAEQTAQQGDQGDTDEGNAAASHQLLHSLTLY